jgi:hypothetical protein
LEVGRNLCHSPSPVAFKGEEDLGRADSHVHLY